MKTKGIEIPQAAIDAGNAAMTGRFRAADIQGAVATALRPLADDQSFDYRHHDKDELDMRVADSLIQKARKLGCIEFRIGGFWLTTKG